MTELAALGTGMDPIASLGAYLGSRPHALAIASAASGRVPPGPFLEAATFPTELAIAQWQASEYKQELLSISLVLKKVCVMPCSAPTVDPMVCCSAS